MIEFIYWVTIGSLLLQIIYWVFLTHYLSIDKRNSDANIAKDMKVSIVICARNEANNLRKSLKSFLTQNGIEYEVIVVNDHSVDETMHVLNEFKQSYPQLIVLEMKESKAPGKKAALRFGIEQARYENILLSDADCRPVSAFWAKSMLKGLDKDHQIVGGYGPFEANDSMVSKFAICENIVTALQYIGLGKAGMPYMAVGRNMGYKAALIKSLNYFESHTDLVAGDDDLTIQNASDKTGVNYITDKETFILSDSPDNWPQYFRQKTRHYSVSGRYPMKFILILGLFGSSWALFYGGLFALAIYSKLMVFGLLLIIRWALVLLCFRRIKIVLDQKIKITDVLLFDAAFPFLMGILSIFGLLKTKQHWK